MKILIKIKNETLEFINKKRLNTEYKNMLNTNVISDNELVFSDEYILANPKIVSSFLQELVNTYNVSIAAFQNIEIANIMIPIVLKLKRIHSLYFESNEVLTYNLCNKINKTNHIDYINAEYIPQYLFEMLNKNHIMLESRNEILFTSTFMNENSLNTYSSIYYKRSIYLSLPFDQNDYEDFDSFLQINNSIKNIHIYTTNQYDLENIIQYLIQYKIRNIKIFIHGDIHDEYLLDYLRKINKNLKSKHNIQIILKYSKQYVKANITNEINSLILKYCSIMIFSLLFLIIGYLVYDNYHSIYKVSQIQESIQEYIEGAETRTTDIEVDEKIRNRYITTLKEMNNDTVGWLKVNNTKIDYPILHTTDNEYYLSHNFNKEKDANGWVYLSSNNSHDELDDNTVIFGHNRYNNGTAMGTLSNILKESWYNNEENQIITYQTETHDYHFRVYSIYVVKVTTDYIKTNMVDSDKQEFINTITERSIHDFNIEATTKDKFLTLSTCRDNGYRLVLHAILESID